MSENLDFGENVCAKEEIFRRPSFFWRHEKTGGYTLICGDKLSECGLARIVESSTYGFNLIRDG